MPTPEPVPGPGTRPAGHSPDDDAPPPPPPPPPEPEPEPRAPSDRPLSLAETLASLEAVHGLALSIGATAEAAKIARLSDTLRSAPWM